MTDRRISPALTILRWLGSTTLWGLAAGLVVYLVFFGFSIEPLGLLWTTAIGAGYTLVMRASQEGVGRLLERRLTLRTRRDVIVRVAVLALVTLVSFIVATLAIDAITGFGLFGKTSTMVIIAIVAVSSSVIGNGYRYLERLHARLVIAEQAAMRSELQALRAQINPHFLFNSLNSIASLVRVSPGEAEQVTEALADLFRYSLRASREPSVNLADELASIELYMEIERARFGDRLSMRVAVPDEILQARVPSLMLQPIVENSVKHGATADRLEIVVRGDLDGDAVVLSIEDNGPGFGAKSIDDVARPGHGLANVRERMRLELGETARMSLAPHRVTLRFPFAREARLHNRSQHDPMHSRR